MIFTRGVKAITALLILASLGLPAAAEKRDKKQAIPKPGEMVWPAPPQQPRVSYQAMITGEADFKKKKKVSFLERLMGEKQEQEKIMLDSPYGIAVGEDGRIFVADTMLRRIIIFDRRDQSIAAWGGNSRISLSRPIGLALDGDSRLFVSDAEGAQVVAFSPEGEPVLSLGADQMARPSGLAIDTRLGRLYVGDVRLHKILVYDLRTLELIKRIGGETGDGEPGPDTLDSPANLALDREGNLYVSDTLMCRVVVFNPEGEFVRSFGQLGDSMGEFARPKGIALDSEGHVYVADAGFGSIQIFNPDGQLLLAVGRSGTAPGYLSLPTGLAIDSQDRIYVAEHWTMERGRMQIFQYLPDNKQSIAVDRAKEIR